jgi:hypothetical protein
MNYSNRNTLRMLQLQGSVCFQQLENYQRRSHKQKHFGVILTPVRKAEVINIIRDVCRTKGKIKQ